MPAASRTCTLLTRELIVHDCSPASQELIEGHTPPAKRDLPTGGYAHLPQAVVHFTVMPNVLDPHHNSGGIT